MKQMTQAELDEVLRSADEAYAKFYTMITDKEVPLEKDPTITNRNIFVREMIKHMVGGLMQDKNSFDQLQKPETQESYAQAVLGMSVMNATSKDIQLLLQDDAVSVLYNSIKQLKSTNNPI
jgi:hypothetical protein